MTPRLVKSLAAALPLAAALALWTGCGGTNQTAAPELSPSDQVRTMLMTRIDSLASENTRLRSQLNAMAAENHELHARVIQLETKLAGTEQKK